MFLNICTDADVLRLLKFASYLLSFVFYAVPIVLIVMVSYDLIKGVISGDASDLKSKVKLSGKRILSAFIIFFVPVVVSLVISILDGVVMNIDINYESCFDNINYIDYYTKLKEAEKIKKLDELANAKKAQKVRFYVKLYKYAGEDDHGSGTSSSGNCTTASGGVNWDNVTQVSNYSSNELSDGIRSSNNKYSSSMYAFLPYVDKLVEAEQASCVNSLFLVAQEAFESGWLKSSVTKTCNNLGGVKYVGQSYGNGKKVSKCTGSPEGDNYAKFDSIGEFMIYHGELLGKHYLTPGASHYHGTRPKDILVDYCGSCGYEKNVEDIGNALNNGVKNR